MLCDECIFVNAEREAGSDISGDAKQKQSGVRGWHRGVQTNKNIKEINITQKYKS